MSGDRGSPGGRRLRFPPSVRERLRAGDDRIVVTGAGGWLGRSTLEMLDDALGDHDLTQRVFAVAARPREQVLRSGRRMSFAPLSELAALAPGPPVRIAHYAFLTRDKVADRPLAEYVAENRRITAFVGSEAARLGAVGTFSTSSGAVYGPERQLATDLERNPYGVLKLAEEAAFARHRDAHGAAAAVCRVFNLAGPFLNKDYALGSFIADALRGGPIHIRASRPVLRSYAHAADVVSVGFAVMLGLAPQPVEPYDTAGAEAVEMQDLAERVRSALGRPDLTIRREAFATDAGEDRYVGDGRVFAALADAAGLALSPLDEQIRDTAAYLAPGVGATRP